MLDAVLCELEGVLVDTAAARRAALARALADDGIALPAQAWDEALGVLSPESALTRLAGGAAAPSDLPAFPAAALDDTARELAALRAGRYFSEALGRAGATLVPGAREALDVLVAAVPVAIVTRARRRDAEQLLALAALAAPFACIVAADDVRSPIPDPAMHRRALDRLARRRPLRPTHVAALVDSGEGVRAARAAGVRPVLVTARADPHASPAGGCRAGDRMDGPAAGAMEGEVAPAPRLASIAGASAPRLAALLSLAPELPR